MLALIAVQEAVAAGLGTGLVPAVGAGTLDGFAVGMLLSGAVFVVLMARRRGAQRARRVAGARRHAGASRLPGRGYREGHREGYRSKHRHSGPEEGPTSPEESPTSPEESRRSPETRRAAPRHAAPSSALAGRFAALMPVRALAATH